MLCGGAGMMGRNGGVVDRMVGQLPVAQWLVFVVSGA